MEGVRAEKGSGLSASPDRAFEPVLVLSKLTCE
jgi:hypothetical protein